MTEAVMVMNNHSNNQNDEWYTPQEYVESARRVMGSIDFDPASTEEANRRIGATEYYTLETDSLRPDVVWRGKVWMNPPYSRVIKHFVKKLVDSYINGTVTEAIIVTNNGTDTLWCHELLSVASAICLHKGRIGFLDSTGNCVQNNNKGQIFFYIGGNTRAFRAEFRQYGKILEAY